MRYTMFLLFYASFVQERSVGWQQPSRLDLIREEVAAIKHDTKARTSTLSRRRPQQGWIAQPQRQLPFSDGLRNAFRATNEQVGPSSGDEMASLSTVRSAEPFDKEDGFVYRRNVDSLAPTGKRMVGQGTVVNRPHTRCLISAYEELGEWGGGEPQIKTFESCDDGATWIRKNSIARHRSPQLFVRSGDVYMLCMRSTFVKGSHVLLTKLTVDGYMWSPPKDIIPSVQSAVLLHNCGFVIDGGRLVFPITTTPNFNHERYTRRVVEVLGPNVFRLEPGLRFARNALLRCGRTFGRVQSESAAGVVTLTVKSYSDQADNCKAGYTISYTFANQIDVYGGVDWLVGVLWLRGGNVDPMDPLNWSVNEGPANPLGHDIVFSRRTFGLYFRGDANVQRAVMGGAFQRAIPEASAWKHGFGDPYWMEPVLLATSPGLLHAILRINNVQRCNTGAVVPTTWNGSKYSFKEEMSIRDLPGLSIAHPAIFWDSESKLHWMVSNVHRNSMAFRTFPNVDAGMKLGLRVAPGTMCEVDRSALALFYSSNGGYDWHFVRFVLVFADYKQSASYPQGFISNSKIYIMVRGTERPTKFGNHDNRDAMFFRINLNAARMLVPLAWIHAKPRIERKLQQISI